MNLFLLIGIIITWHVTKSASKSIEKKPHGLDSAALKAQITNEFSSDLYKTVARTVSGNVAFSPYDPFISLSTAVDGDRERSLFNLRTISRNEEEDSSDDERGLQALFDRYKSSQTVNLTSANKIFYRAGYEPRSDYRDVMEMHLRMTPQSIDFDNPSEASSLINKWMKIQTNNRVTDLVTPDDLKGNTSLIIVNVVYFKAKWFRPFILLRDNLTFHVNETKEIMIPYMRKLDFYVCGELPEIRAKFLSIPFEVDGSEEEISMFIILPNNPNDLKVVEDNIKNITIDRLLKGHVEEIYLLMPKFSIKSKIVLSEPLKNKQLRKIFEDGNTSDNTEDDSNQDVSKLIQTVAIEVDEKSEFRGLNASPLPGTRKFTVNHPFISIIARTRKNPLIFFTSRYTGSEHVEGE